MSQITIELQEARAKLASREKARDHMKEVNALIRKHKGNNEVITPLLIAMGIPASKAHELLNPRYSYEVKGYQGWELSNNGAEIRRLTDRVKMLESKEQTRTEIATTEGAAQPEKVINGVRIVEDYEADRVQLFFDGKPAENIRTECKRAGFKWAPSAGAWQRKINNAAIYQAERIAKLMPPVEAAEELPPPPAECNPVI